jgi:RecA/RadA recombinase
MATSIKKEFSFLELDKALSKIEGFEMGSLLETNEFSEVSEWIPTGNYLFNAQLSGSLFGGVANNRSLGLAGDPGTGKTFLCLNIVREAQKMGYDIIYCDTEGAIDRNQVKKFGADVSRVRYQPMKTISDFKVFVANFVDLVNKAKKNGASPKILIVVDSLGMLTTEKSVSDALKGKTASDMGLRSKEMRDVFRNITLDLTGLKVPLICTNHTTMAGIGGYIQTKEAAGGDGPIFSMSNVVLLSKSNLKEDDKKTGIIVTSTFKKARFTRPYPIKFHISFMNGMNPYVGLEEFVSWESCGIERGKLEVDKKTGEMKFTPVASSPNWAVAHLGKTVPSRRLFTAEVFTEEVLRKLDENVIKPHFLLPEIISDSDLDGIFEDENTEEENIDQDGQE